MPAAKTKKELIAVTEKEYAKLEELISLIPSQQATEKNEDDTSLKDIIGHRAHWINLFLGWHKDGKAGKEVFFPAKGYKWSELKKYNQQLRSEGWTIHEMCDYHAGPFVHSGFREKACAARREYSVYYSYRYK